MTQKKCTAKKGKVKPCGVNKPAAKGKKMASYVTSLFLVFDMLQYNVFILKIKIIF